MKVLFDTESKTTAFIEDGAATVVHPTEETVVVKADGSMINPATGQPYKGTTPGYGSEISEFLTGIISTRPGPTITTEGDSTPKRTLRPGDTIPWPSAEDKIETFAVVQAVGIATYKLSPVDGIVGIGQLKGRALNGDNFAVEAELTENPSPDLAHMALTHGGAMGFALHFGPEEPMGYANLRPGATYYLHVNNLTGEPMAFQVQRP